MFVWIVHRITGLLLIVGLSLKFLTSFFLMTKQQKPDWALVLHTNPLLDIGLLVSVIFHAFYGLRTIMVDLGVKKEKLLFWVFTSAGILLSAALIVVYFTRNY
jgi:succinate dehydrogenase / fumarate reductase cytochrome b subunit